MSLRVSLMSACLCLVACAAVERRDVERPAARPPCPIAGSPVPFAQLTSQADRFVGCEVTTEAEFVGTGTGPGYFLFNTAAQTVFRVVPPGQAASLGAYGLPDASFAAISDDAAAPIFSARTGQRIGLRGKLEYRKLAWVDQGNFSRLFRASAVKVDK